MIGHHITIVMLLLYLSFFLRIPKFVQRMSFKLSTAFVMVTLCVPFYVRLILQVIMPIIQWEAKSFGRPVLAVVIIASLALFPVVLLPSGPPMWLTGIVFGYGFGFLIIMAGVTIGMSLPYWIGLLFRDHLNVMFLSSI